jgi:hypothetical protein
MSKSHPRKWQRNELKKRCVDNRVQNQLSRKTTCRRVSHREHGEQIGQSHFGDGNPNGEQKASPVAAENFHYRLLHDVVSGEGFLEQRCLRKL